MIFVAVIASFFCTALSASDAAENGRRQRAGAQKRAAIRAMPILQRPSRPGHFYGNTVRRNAASKPKQMSVVAKQRGLSPATNPIEVQQKETSLPVDLSKSDKNSVGSQVSDASKSAGQVAGLESKLSLGRLNPLDAALNQQAGKR